VRQEGRVVAIRTYDEIGDGYRDYRRPDKRIGHLILNALGDADTVVNVGGGAGSYEPAERSVIAVEPSPVMIGQRPPGSAPVVRASAMNLPFGDGSFDAALAILTVHHWPDRARGLSELRRVARDRVVIVTSDPATSGFWLTEDYFPAIRELDRQTMPSMEELNRSLENAEILSLPVPHDCVDGFLGAYWRRPHAYLDDGIRKAISAFSMVDGVDSGLARLYSDLIDGVWHRKYGHLSRQDEMDLGYRLVIGRRQ